MQNIHAYKLEVVEITYYYKAFRNRKPMKRPQVGVARPTPNLAPKVIRPINKPQPRPRPQTTPIQSIPAPRPSPRPSQPIVRVVPRPTQANTNNKPLVRVIRPPAQATPAPTLTAANRRVIQGQGQGNKQTRPVSQPNKELLTIILITNIS